MTSRSCPASPKNTSFSFESCSLNDPYVLCLNFFSVFLLFLLITFSPLMASIVIQNISPPWLLRLWMFQAHVSELFQKPIYYVFPKIVCISHIYTHVIYTHNLIYASQYTYLQFCISQHILTCQFSVAPTLYWSSCFLDQFFYSLLISVVNCIIPSSQTTKSVPSSCLSILQFFFPLPFTSKPPARSQWFLPLQYLPFLNLFVTPLLYSIVLGCQWPSCPNSKCFPIPVMII